MTIKLNDEDLVGGSTPHESPVPDLPDMPQFEITEQMVSSLDIEVFPRPVRAFQETRGLWAVYDRIHRDRISSLLLAPVILGEWSEDGDYGIYVNCYFDPEEFDTRTYGLPYTDGQLVDEVSDWMRAIFGSEELTTLGYLEQGAQTETRICFRGGPDWLDHLAGMTGKEFARLTMHPDVARAVIGRLHWNRWDEKSCSEQIGWVNPEQKGPTRAIDRLQKLCRASGV